MSLVLDGQLGDLVDEVPDQLVGEERQRRFHLAGDRPASSSATADAATSVTDETVLQTDASPHRPAGRRRATAGWSAHDQRVHRGLW